MLSQCAQRIEQVGRALLLQADCRDVLPLLPKVDAVVTDPPYGIASVWKGGFSQKHGWGKAQQEAGLRNEWDEAIPSNDTMALVLAAAPEVIIWGGNYFDLPPSRCWLAWNKPERNFSLAEAELAWTNRDNVVRVVDCPRSESDREHPTQKPVELVERALNNSSKAGDIVINCFGGSGSTLVACEKTNRHARLMELDPKYCDVIIKRWQDFTGQKAVHAETGEVFDASR
jgi:DNA modification methylase